APRLELDQQRLVVGSDCERRGQRQNDGGTRGHHASHRHGSSPHVNGSEMSELFPDNRAILRAECPRPRGHCNAQTSGAQVVASDAFVVVVPGGSGTVLEMLMLWQLLQERHVRDVPLVINADDLTIPQCVETADEAIALIRVQHDYW